MATKVKNKKKISGGSLAAIIISVLILLALVVSLLASTGLFTRMKKGVSTENFSVNGAMMEYFFGVSYSNWYSQNILYIYYGLIDFDPSESFKTQYTSSDKTQTYYDYFKESVINEVTTMLKYCEAAKADSTINFAEYEKKGEDAAKETVDLIKETASEQGVTVDYLLATNYGENVSLNDIKKATKLLTIASEYSQVVQDRFFDAVKDDEISKYFADNLSTFVTAEYLTYSLKSTGTPDTVKADDYEGGEESKAYQEDLKNLKEGEEAPDPADYVGGKDSAAYKAKLAKNNEETKKHNDTQKEKDQEFLNKLAEAKDAEEFKKILLEREYDSAFDTAYTTAVKSFADADKPTEDVKDAFKAEIKDKVIEAVLKEETDIELDHDHDDEEELSKWEEASHGMPKSIITTLTSKITSAEKSASYALEEDLDKFLFGGVKAEFGIEYDEKEDKDGTSAKVGETKIIDEVTNSASGEYTLSVYYVTEAAGRPEETLRDVGHILIQFDSSITDTTEVEEDKAQVKKEAEDLYNELLESATKDGELNIVTKEVFEELANKKNEDSNVFYEDVAKGQMVESFEEWLFAAEKVGQLGLVETTYGWHVMFYVGENEDGQKAWELTAQNGVTADKMDDWFENLPYEVEVNEKIFDSFMK